jgi:hypothetical protein
LLTLGLTAAALATGNHKQDPPVNNADTKQETMGTSRDTTRIKMDGTVRKTISDKNGTDKTLKIIFENDSVREILVDGKPVPSAEMHKYDADVAKIRAENENAKRELEKAHLEMNHAQKQMELAQQKMKEAQEEMQKAREAMMLAYQKSGHENLINHSNMVPHKEEFLLQHQNDMQEKMKHIQEEMTLKHFEMDMNLENMKRHQKEMQLKNKILHKKNKDQDKNDFKHLNENLDLMHFDFPPMPPVMAGPGIQNFDLEVAPSFEGLDEMPFPEPMEIDEAVQNNIDEEESVDQLQELEESNE